MSAREPDIVAAESTEPLLPAAARSPFGVRSIRSEQLFGGDRELLIEHVGAEYRLRITSQGKLILTK